MLLLCLSPMRDATRSQRFSAPSASLLLVLLCCQDSAAAFDERIEEMVEKEIQEKMKRAKEEDEIEEQAKEAEEFLEATSSPDIPPNGHSPCKGYHCAHATRRHAWSRTGGP